MHKSAQISLDPPHKHTLSGKTFSNTLLLPGSIWHARDETDALPKDPVLQVLEWNGERGNKQVNK